MDISVSYLGGKKVAAQVAGHVILTDQATRSGGDGSAPSPFDLFLASIATCAGYYVYDFCMSRRISTTGVQVVMRTERDQATGMIDRIDVEIHLPPDFPAKYDKAVVRAADLCAVKKHLVNPPHIETHAKRVRPVE